MFTPDCSRARVEARRDDLLDVAAVPVVCGLDTQLHDQLPVGRVRAVELLAKSAKSSTRLPSSGPAGHARGDAARVAGDAGRQREGRGVGAGEELPATDPVGADRGRRQQRGEAGLAPVAFTCRVWTVPVEADAERRTRCRHGGGRVARAEGRVDRGLQRRLQCGGAAGAGPVRAGNRDGRERAGVERDVERSASPAPLWS